MTAIEGPCDCSGPHFHSVIHDCCARLAAVLALCNEEDPEMTFPEWQNKIREAAQGETAEHYDAEDAHGNPVCVCPDINREYDGG